MRTFDVSILFYWTSDDNDILKSTLKTYTYKSYMRPSNRTLKSFADRMRTRFSDHMSTFDSVDRVIVKNVRLSNIRVTERLRVNIIRQRMRGQKITYDGFGILDTQEEGQCVIKRLLKYGFKNTYITNWFQTNTNIDINKGISPAILLQFCKAHKITFYCCDLQLNKVVSYNSHDRNKQPLIIINANNHLYEITSKPQRMAISKRHLIAYSKKKATNATKSNITLEPLPEQFINFFRIQTDLYDDPFDPIIEELPEHKHYYVPSSDYYLERLFLYLLHHDKTISQTKDINDRIRKITWKRKDTIIYMNDNLEHCQTICEELGLNFTNQPVATLTHHILDQQKIKLDKLNSYYNNTTLNIVKSMPFHPFVHNFQDLSSDEFTRRKNSMVSIDIRRCYTSIIKNYYMPIINALTMPEEYQDEPLTDAFYYVITDNFELFYGNNWYPKQVIESAIKHDIPHRITHYLPYKKTDLLRKYTKSIHENYTDKTAKLAINTMVGLLGKKQHMQSYPVYTLTERDAGYYAILNDQPIHTYQSHDLTYYKIPSRQDEFETHNTRLIYSFILSIGRMKAFELLQSMRQLKYFKPLQVKTDAVLGYFTSKKDMKVPNIKPKEECKPGEYSKQKIKVNTLIKTPPYLQPDETQPTYALPEEGIFNKLIISRKWHGVKFAQDCIKKYQDGFCCIAPAGSGKTYLLINMRQLLEEEYGKEQVATVAFTGVASSLITNSKTLHSMFCIKSSELFQPDHRTLAKLARQLKYVFVDEISMLGLPHYQALLQLKQYNPKITFFMFGDDLQLPPVNVEKIHFTSQPIYDLVKGNMIELEYNFRNGKFAQQLRKCKFNDLQLPRNQTQFKTLDLCNITHTNELADKINDYLIQTKKAPKTGFHNSIVRFSARYGNIPKNYIAKVICENNEYTLKRMYAKGDDITFTKDEFKKVRQFLQPAYAFTNYKAQGLTIDTNYTIWEFDHIYFKKEAKYTALSRCQDKNQVRTTNQKLGFIYQININEDSYIGKTHQTLQERITQHLNAKDKLPLHQKMRENTDDITYKYLHHIIYDEEEELLAQEGKFITKYAPTLNRGQPVSIKKAILKNQHTN